jgi:hypothetical protein
LLDHSIQLNSLINLFIYFNKKVAGSSGINNSNQNNRSNGHQSFFLDTAHSTDENQLYDLALSAGFQMEFETFK